MKRYVWKSAIALLALGLLAGGALTDERPAEPYAARLLPVPVARVQADLNGDRLFDDLAAALAGAPPHQPFDVILRCRPGHEEILSHLAGRVARALPRDRSVAARLTAEEIRQLAASEAVESIEKNGRVVLARDTACASFGVTKARADFGLTGDADGKPQVYSPADMTIAVIDTGIDAAHPDLAGKVIGWQDFVAGRRDPYDEAGHGTHVASIAAGRGGVAPGASLVALKVAQEQETTVDLVVAAIDWCVAQRERFGIDVVNLSLAMEGPGDGTDAQSRAVERAVAAGLVVCVAAGNAGPGYYTIGGAGTAVDAITVGNMLDLGKGGFALRFKSSRGPTLDGRIKPDLCAPGTAILAAKANSPDTIAMTGTSMASAFAAGVAALIRQTDPTLTPAEVKLRLQRTALAWGRSLQVAAGNNDYGAGRLDGYAAIAAGASTVGSPPPVPRHVYREGALTGTGGVQEWIVPVDGTRFPLALTLLIYAAGSDFDLRVFGPDGTLAAVADGTLRQETVQITPTAPGAYRIVVSSFEGSGAYSLDISAETRLP